MSTAPASCRRLIRLLACMATLSACGTNSAGSNDAEHDGDHASEDGGASTADEPRLPVTRDGQLDLSGGAWRMIEVPDASNAPSIVHTPDGWLALSSRTLGGKEISAEQTALYRSVDGVSWELIPLGRGDLLALRSIAYGNGHYVMVGRHQADGVVWVSDDATHWTESSQGLEPVNRWSQVAFVGGRFIAFGFRVLGVSDDGKKWQTVTVDLVQMMGVAHGNDRFVMTGSGPVITSDDGLHWQSRTIDCSLPDTCITDPSGGTHPAILASVLFAEHQFFAGRLASPDGVTWSVASEVAPDAFVDGRFLSLQNGTLLTWTLGQKNEMVPTVRSSKAAVTAAGRGLTSVGVLDQASPLPERVSVVFEDGLSCDKSPCVLVDGRLFLVPPPGTPPLPDRVPRDAAGDPLLSDECPVSRMIFCEDYEARTKCACRADAPRDPAACAEISEFTCEGAFVHRKDEWNVDEVAEGGCSCDGSDPNQPPTFGLPCEPGASTPPAEVAECQLPLMCLPVQAPPSEGPPGPQPFICTAACTQDADCPTWRATGFCAGEVKLRCAEGSCQPRTCE